MESDKVIIIVKYRTYCTVHVRGYTIVFLALPKASLYYADIDLTHKN